MAKPTGQKQIKHGHEYWQSHIDAWQQSGLTRAAYCKHNDLNLQTFAYWKHRFKAGSPAVRLVQLPAQRQTEQCALRLVIAGGFAIEVADNFSASTLVRLVEVVRGL